MSYIYIYIYIYDISRLRVNRVVDEPWIWRRNPSWAITLGLSRRCPGKPLSTSIEINFGTQI